MSSKKDLLLSDENVRRWYDNLYSASPHTAIPRLYRLSRFCERASLDPEELVKLDQKKLEDLVQDKVREMERDGNAPDYVHGVITAVKSWLKHNEREIKRDIKIRGIGESRIQSEEKVPEPSQLDTVFPVATVRARVSIAIMAFSGVRPEVLGNFDGTNGLVLKDIPDLVVPEMQFSNIPAQVVVRRELSKVRHQYFTFLNERGCEFLLAYLKQRVEAGEVLSPDSPIIKSDSRKKLAALKAYPNELKFFVCTQNITEEIRRALRKAGLTDRPYVWRSYFASHLLEAELDGKIATDIRAFFEGHKGTIERVYTIGKHNLPKDMMQKVRNQYLQGSPYLDGTVAQEMAKQAIKENIESEVQEQYQKVIERQNKLFELMLISEKNPEIRSQIQRCLEIT